MNGKKGEGRQNSGKGKATREDSTPKKGKAERQGEEAEEEEDTKKGNAKGKKVPGAVAPVPALGKGKNKASTKSTVEESKNSKISVDISKFVTEGRGDIQDRYTICKVVGKGAFGEVRMAIDKSSNNVRAMKVIPKEICTGVNSETLLNEVGVLKKLDHPNIIRIFEFYQDETNYYLITEFCSGGELFDRILKMKRFSEAEAAHLMKQVLSAVTYCHAKSIVHRYP